MTIDQSANIPNQITEYLQKEITEAAKKKGWKDDPILTKMKEGRFSEVTAYQLIFLISTLGITVNIDF